MILLGLSGKKRSGKNTVAALIKANTRLEVQEFAFADTLKQEVAKMCSVKAADIEADKDLYRPLLQAWGVFCRKKHGEDYWIIKTMRQMIVSKADVLIVTDVRFENELRTLVDVGAHIIRINRPDIKSVDEHESETQLDGFPFQLIVENTTLDLTARQVKLLMKQLNIPTK